MLPVVIIALAICWLLYWRSNKLSRENRRLKILLEEVESPVLMLDGAGDIVYCNRHFPGEPGENFLDCIPEKDYSRARRVLLEWSAASLRGEAAESSFEAGIGERIYFWRVNRRTDEELDHCHLLFGVDITERKRKEKELSERTYRDPLTGVFSRAYFEELSREDLFPALVMAVDVDGLKEINDTYGHEAGDKLIRSAADCLVKALRGNDLVMRTGGDEFVCVLTNLTDSAERVGDVVARRIAREAEKTGLSLSIGFCHCRDLSSLSEAVACADLEMYSDKRRKKEER